MKKLLYLLFCLPFFFACEKDDSLQMNHKRIKQMSMSNDVIEGALKVFYNYENNLLVNRTVLFKSNSSYNTWDTTLNCHYTYEGNMVIAISYFGEDGPLYLAEKAEYEFTDQRMDRMKFYEYVDGKFISREEIVFHFNGALLESFDFHMDVEGNGILHKVSKGEYTYDDQQVIQYRLKDLYYDMYFYNEEFAYENGMPKSWFSSGYYANADIWINEDKEEYQYNSDGLLEKTRFYNWQNKWFKTHSLNYQYEDGHLIREYFSDNTGGLEVEYVYENQAGNSEQILFTPMDRMYNSPIIESIYDGSMTFKRKYMMEKTLH